MSRTLRAHVAATSRGGRTALLRGLALTVLASCLATSPGSDIESRSLPTLAQITDDQLWEYIDYLDQQEQERTAHQGEQGVEAIQITGERLDAAVLSDTNVQEAGVCEGGIVKLAGR